MNEWINKIFLNIFYIKYKNIGNKEKKRYSASKYCRLNALGKTVLKLIKTNK